MNWNTIYITGKGDFREEVRKRLLHADLDLMPGYIEESGDGMTHDLYWLSERTDLRSFKEAIGSKLIWKYRLRFNFARHFASASNDRGRSLPRETPVKH